MSFTITVEERTPAEAGASVCDSPPPVRAVCDSCLYQPRAICDSCIVNRPGGPQGDAAPLSPLDD